MKNKIISWFLFMITFIAELSAGFYVCHIKGYIFTDAFSRVANAFNVLYIHPPHLAAIGDIWNPLPSLLELPLMLLWPIYKPIASSCLAGVVMTSAFAAGSAVLLYKYAVHYGRSSWVGILLALLYCFNPFFFIYGFNGMSEVPFSFILLWLVIQYTEWIEDGASQHLFKMGIALMLGFSIRYEIIPISFGVWLGFTLLILFVHRKKLDEERQADFRYSLQQVDGKSFVLLTPMAFAIFVWMMYCWVIEGNPLYFLNSSYSNLAFSARYALNPVLRSMMGHPALVLKYLFFASKFFLISLVVVIIYRLIRKTIFKWDFFALVLLLISTLALQFCMLNRGTSAGEFRYYIYSFPIIAAWLPYEFKKTNSWLFTSLCLISLLIADIFLGFTWIYTSDLTVAQEKIKDFCFQNTPIEASQKDVARFINHNLPHARILMDTVQTYAAVVSINNPQNLVVTCSYQFKKAVKDPQRYKIDYIVIPSPVDNDVIRTDAINKKYPNLYVNGADWCTEYKQFGKYYKIFRVKSEAISTLYQ